MAGWVYIFASPKHGTLYIGVTSHLLHRTFEHREGLVDGFTKRHRVKMLVYYEQFAHISEAIHREKTMKHWPRAWKLNLIRGFNPEWRDLFADITN
jgi:putative endonuclease